jgi:long-chain acyl-CoA synthetase
LANFYQLFAAAAAKFPNRTAIEVVRERPPAGQDAGLNLESWTYANLEGDAARWSAWLVERGIQPGDRCAILADNDARWICAYFGVLRVGAVAVPLDTNYKAHQIKTVADNCDARLILTTEKYRALVDEAAPARIRADIYLDADARPKARANDAPPVVDRKPDDAAVLLYTSGTTSDPKGVILSHGNLEAERSAAFKIITLSENDAVLGVLPLFHALAQLANLLLPLIVGGRVVFLETVSSSSLLGALQGRGITIFACVPQFFYLIHQRVMAEVAKRGRLSRAIFRAMLSANGWLRDHGGLNPGRRWFARVHHTLGDKMRVLVTGGSKFDPVISRDLYALGFTLLNAYGLTECTGGATIARPDDTWNTSVGAAIDRVEIAIRKDTTGTGREHDDGEVLIRGPIVMQGYFGRPDATAEVLKDGWLYTGDLGYLDARGRLYITGRSKEIIVLSSGKNLYPEEIEAHYRQSPIIKEICVLGMTKPGEPSAERLHAVIVPDDQLMRDKGLTNVRELVRFDLEGLSVQLPAHKRVLTYDIWSDPLPRTSTNKVKRHEVERRVRERAATESADDQKPRAMTEAERAWAADEDRAGALDAIREKLKRPGVSPDSNLELDLTLDSMERVELVTMVEQRFGTKVAPETRAKIFTVRELVDAVMAAEASRGGSAAAPWATVLAQDPGDGIVEHLKEQHVLIGMAFFVTLRAMALVSRVFFRFRASGVENLPRDGAFLLCPNHQSYIDAFVVLSALPWPMFRRLFFVGASEYFESPTMSKFARATNIVPVDANTNLVRALQAGAAGLRLGRILVLFPEGERSIDGELKTFRKGAAVLASQLNVPIVPVALDGLWQLWPRSRGFQWRALVPGRGKPVRLAFAPPIQVTPGDDEATATELRRSLEATFLKIRAPR